MSGSLTLTGSLQVNGTNCVVGCPPPGSADIHVIGLSLAPCASKFFESVPEAAVPISIATAGALGSVFVDLSVIGDLTSIEFLYLQSNTDVIVRIGADVARLTSSGGTFPTSFSGGETLLFTVDGTAVTVMFTSGAQLAQDVANEINAAAALLGLAPPASLNVSGVLQLESVLTGSQGSIAVTGGTGASTIGFAATPSAVGAGADVRFSGLFLSEFSRSPNAPTRIQVSGVAQLKVLAAGRSTA